MERSKALAGTLIKGTVPLPGGATAIYSGTSGMPYIRHHSASFRASIASLLLPDFSSAFLRGLHTTRWATRRDSRS